MKAQRMSQMSGHMPTWPDRRARVSDKGQASWGLRQWFLLSPVLLKCAKSQAGQTLTHLPGTSLLLLTCPSRSLPLPTAPTATQAWSPGAIPDSSPP